MTKKHTIFLVDDHGIVREGIKRLLERQPDMNVVGEAESGEEAIAAIKVSQPDVVLMDISLPDTSGIETTRQILEVCPSTRILALTVHEDDGYIREILRNGAVGYLLKRIPVDELALAVRTVAAGGIYIDPRVANKIVKVILDPKEAPEARDNLSERELSVLKGVAKGYSTKEIATLLSIGIKSVETYKARGMEKLKLKGRVDLVRLAAARGWFSE